MTASVRYEVLFHRYPGNPILTAADWPYPAHTVFNAGATRLADGTTLLLCRVEDRRGHSHLCAARSDNGVDGWRIDSEPTLSPDPERHPEELWGIEDPRITFVNRDHGSGTRTLLEHLLTQEKIDGRVITGYQNVELTHAAVAAHVASGMADAGFGVEAAAVQFDLDFIHVVTEDYFFVCREPVLRSNVTKRLIDIISGPEYRRAIGTLPGYSVSDPGVVKTVKNFLRSHS